MILEPLGSATRIAFGEFIADLRRRKRVSRLELSYAIGISVDALGRIERGDRRLLVLEFLAICQVLRVDAPETIRRFEAIVRPR